MIFRNPFFDILKAVAIFMVVMQHCYQYLSDGIYESCAINQSISLISVPLFMMVSGYFMFSSKLDITKLFQRERSLLLPFMFWSLIYFCIFHSIFYDGITLAEFLSNLLTAPYFCSQLWFFRTLAIITFITYFCKKLSGHNDVISLSIVFCLITAVSILITKEFALQSLTGNLGYFIIGYAANKYSFFSAKWFPAIGKICIVAFLTTITLKINHIQSGGILFKICNYTGIISMTWIIQKLSGFQVFNSRSILYLGSHTMEVYATHFLWVYILMLLHVPVLSQIPNIMIILWSLTTIVLSLATASIINRIPYIKTLIYGRPTSRTVLAVR